PGNRKWTEKIWTDISECYSKNGAKCQSRAPKPTVRFRPPGTSRAIPSTKRMRITKRNFRSTCMKPTCGFSEQSRRPSLELDVERLALVSTAGIQSLAHD